MYTEKQFWALDGSSVGGGGIFGLSKMLMVTAMFWKPPKWKILPVDTHSRSWISLWGIELSQEVEWCMKLLKWLPKAAERGDCFEFLAATWWLLYWKVFKANCRSCKWHLYGVRSWQCGEHLCGSGEMHESAVKYIKWTLSWDYFVIDTDPMVNRKTVRSN